MTLIALLYIVIFVVAVQAFLLYYRIEQPVEVDRILRGFIMLITMDISMMYIFKIHFRDFSYISTAAPFGLAYTPLLYWMYKVQEQKKITTDFFALHSTPLAIAFIVYLCFITVPHFREAHTFNYFIVLNAVMCISWAGYPFLILFKGGKALFKQSAVFKYFIVVLLLLVSFMLPLIWSSYQDGVYDVSTMSSVIVAVVMLSAVLLSYNYMLGRATSYTTAASNAMQEGKTAVFLNGLVTKESKDENVILDSYKAKITAYLALGKYYDVNFNLEQMAKDLHIPKTIISQYFVQEYEEGFVKTINSWRIAKACEFLAQEDFDQSMEDLAMLCGFNSRASFYRNFNLEKGCTPTTYRTNALN